MIIGLIVLIVIAGAVLAGTLLPGANPDSAMDQMEPAAIAEKFAGIMSASAGLGYSQGEYVDPRSIRITHARMTVSDRIGRQQLNAEVISLQGVPVDERPPVGYATPARSRIRLDARA